MSESRNEMRKIAKKRKRMRRLIFALVFVLFLAGGVGVYAMNLINKAEEVVKDSYEDDGREEGSELRDVEVDPQQDNISILFIGIDESEKRLESNQTNKLSDALILATLNSEDHSVKLLSIPRDTYTYVPERDRYTKINHAHSYGGPKATIETVESFLNVPVDYYVRVNFNAFMDVVDTLGGITVDVPVEIYEQDSNDVANAIHLTPGVQQLDGEEALALARTRKIDNDIERGKRQQEIIKAIMKRALSVDSVLKYDDIMEAVGDNMKTNMTFHEMQSLISYAKTGNINIETYTLDGTDTYIDNIYYYQVDETSLANVSNTLNSHLSMDTTTNVLAPNQSSSSLTAQPSID
ncbi:transcriptional attenuator, LytR family [Gracilibacillus ureilyticus]|uniref:Transcriptional attenuator, LytR family n=1 Tax=Gracilibacillus ureilyticus TaxID=531814 RepID=A0A1H9RBG0_9BACI|nr:LCP family protein [Gracilibacillus ureilyticus]SER70044.1 transcriptional attenuator, LytR family [Gracilibacillus ureilyticus]